MDHSAENVVKVRIAANFTVEPIEEFLAYWMSEFGIPCEIRFAPYNQVFQQLLEGGLLRTNLGGINLVALDPDAWLGEGPFEAAREQLEQTVADFGSVLRAASARGAGGAVLLFPPSADPNQSEERTRAIAAARTSLLKDSQSVHGWSVLDLADTVKLYSISEPRDPFTDELGNIPFTEEMYAAAATASARWIRAICREPRKVIVLDCDETLWSGNLGEGALEVTPPYQQVQQFILRQRDGGMLLTLASTNDEAEVMTALESDTCLLKPEDFAAWQINRLPKPDSLRSLAEELGFALDSFVFISGSAEACMEVLNHCPEVLTVQLPSDPVAILPFLQHMWVFDRQATLITPVDQFHSNLADDLAESIKEGHTMMHVAAGLQTASAVVAAVRTGKKRRPVEAGPLVAPRNPVEESLARIWSECLAIEPIGAMDNFFDFGGHSLIATRILTRVRSEFGVELSFNKLFEKPTIEGMASGIMDASIAPVAANRL